MASRPGHTGTTFLTGTQAAQLLEKLKEMKNVEGQTIKIQTIQTNPHTGAKQIVAIPLPTASLSVANSGAGQSSITTAHQNLNISPLKTVKTLFTEQQQLRSPISTATTMIHSGLMQGTTRTIKIGSPRPISVSVATGATGQTPPFSIIKTSGASSTVSTGIKGVSSLLVQNVGEQNGTAGKAVSLSMQGSHSSNGHQAIALPLTPQKQVVTTSLGNVPLQNMTFESVKRPHDFDSLDIVSEAKRRKTEKGGKGLRHFSMKVCEKVKAKGSTSYNEVADELVTELTDPMCQSPTDQQYDQKNIRRRVYDALNVLMAMNIISKEKKEIRWLGLPTNSVQEAYSLENEKAERIERIKAKTQQLQDLILQQIAFKNLVERNKDNEKVLGAPTPNSAIQLPFIVVNTSKKTVIDCSISNDKMEYLFNFDNTFEIHDDMEVLKRMNMTLGLENGSISAEDMKKVKNLVPKALQKYVDEMAQQGAEAYKNLMPKVSPPKLQLKEEVNTDYDDEEFPTEDQSDQDD